MESKLITLDSINYYVLHEGAKDRPLVILCHALMANHHMWDSTVGDLHKAGFSTLRFDHIGHNKTTFSTSEAATREYHFDDVVRHIHELVQRVAPGQAPFGFVGCSVGGVLAIRYAQMYPGTLNKVMSCDAPGLTSLEVAKPLWKARISQFQNEGVENLAKATVERWFPEPCREEVRSGMLEQTRACTFEGYRACAIAVMNYDYFAELKRIEKEQVLVLAGANDTAIGPREILVNVANAIPGAKYILMENVGHIPPYHDSSGFNKIMLEFLGSKEQSLL
ncbi:hypothetical protein N7510_011565 [Penicillium lagena]|uniref:uncharacterized protein n=1 Tax=Penicillium lagena TaxID=94218 RepID=UPI002540D8C0|nr:uncharacterized protein N7510_011565 [Penicillium lagena]KAJ5602031.1 hypothetical protein N7510_011565 [Penicillium lagena]